MTASGYKDVQPTPDSPTHASTGPLVPADQVSVVGSAQDVAVEDVTPTEEVEAPPVEEETVEPTLYKHVGEGSIDESAWPDSGKVDADGDKLYTFSGDTQPGDANGASDEWVVTQAV